MFVSKEVQEQRLAICKGCEHRKNRFLAIFKMDSCGICKCNLRAKTKLEKDFFGECPINKW